MSGSPRDLGTLLEARSVLLCCGSGGVGKTTTAAALALGAAVQGRRVCVVTIDPARRLADALGAAEVGNVPHRIEGPFSGELHAVMLDARGTFDDLVRRYAKDAGQAERILANRLYANLVSALSGTQEYMATEKLFELYEGGEFDLIVVDTPPTRNALDFLDAPRRLSGFLDNRIFRLLITPSRAYLRAVSLAAQVLLRTLSKVAGSEIVEDTVAFFQAFEGMEAGFRARAGRVEQLLGEQSTGFVLVAAPHRDSVAEAAFLAERLTSGGHSVDALVVNRVLEEFGGPLPPAEGRSARSSDAKAPAGPMAAVPAGAYEALVGNLAELAALARSEGRLVADLADQVAPAPVVRVPELEADVHDLDGLALLARHLLGGELPWPDGEGAASQ